MGLIETYSIKREQEQDPDHVFASDEGVDFVICKSPDKLKKLIDAITKHSTVFYLSDGYWSMHDLIMELLKRYQPAELFLSTYALRELSIRQLILAQERKELLSINMLLDYRAPVRIPAVFQLAKMNMNKIGLCKIHAKVFILRTATHSISIVTSANLTSNPRIECGAVSMNKGLAEFHINWINKILENAEIFE